MTCDRKIGPYPCCSVVQGDCLQLMRELPDGCVDAAITDPPYNFEPIGGGICGKREYQKSLDALDICSFSSAEFLRVAPRVGTLAAFCNKALLPEYLAWAVTEKLSFDVHVAWKHAPIPAFGSHFLSDAEYVVLFRRSGATWLMDAPFDCYRKVVPFGTVDGKQHPAEKPEYLVERYLRICVRKDGAVLDPFCGSGTTLVAAKKLGRHFLGFEISAEYCEIARRRLKEIDDAPTLFESHEKPVQLTIGGGK